jgi:hypothetical protein
MAGDEIAPWPIEVIPDEDSLYYRIHRQWVSENRPRPSAFQDRGGAMSTDWCKYATPEEARGRAPKPDDNGVVGLGVGDVRGLEGQSVHHTPDQTHENRAHTDVRGEKTPEVRVKLSRLAAWEIEL